MQAPNTFTLPQDLLPEFGTFADELIQLTPSETVLGQGVRQLVKTKSLLDLLTKERGGSAVVGQVMGSHYSYGTIDAYSYVHALLPFFRSPRERSKESADYKALVSPEITIGESWKWTPESETKEHNDAVVRASFNALVEEKSSHAASYTLIPKLGLVLAAEGKNRVALFRKLDLPIPALVSDQDYPDAKRIRLIYLDRATFAILDDRYVQRLASPELTRIILEPYGVKVEKVWPESYPSLERIFEAFDRKAYSADSRFNDIDMQPVQYRQLADETIIPASLMDFEKGLRPSLLTIFYGFAIALMLSVITGMFWEVRLLSTITLSLAVTCYAALMLAFAPLFRCQVQQLGEDAAQRHRLDLIEKYSRNNPY
ncbi:hypothetical protein DBR37_09065 [Herminiimonas sp. KBW02]|uniref:Uncharacterized protein n=1 Tax=Herminiimonas glaciei TaxID=523788 RepID=A0ABW2I8Q3_9BURK|nr:hypothetical protein [Herminiimonas sp. KBW02]RQO36448.1 hypothetical protein DBR37_09065 [Herminiimonas sp. KBW02]